MSFKSSPIDQDVKEQVRLATDIVDLIGSQLPLRRQGKLYVAHCPWHDDARPSLQVDPNRQSWKCWVCDLGGDVFSFVMKREGVGFPEALQMLADRAGIRLTKATQGAVPAGSPQDKRTLYRAIAWAEEKFHRCLVGSPEGAAAREYLASRGISQESVTGFRLGFSRTDWTWLIELGRREGLSEAVLEAAGLAGRSERSGRCYDRFRGRVIFPIRDPQGRPIAFGGRILPGEADAKAAKYINSPETRLFSKSDQLYGLDAARDAVARGREIVIVEGYTDALLAHQHGIGHVAAVLGTALGPRHIALLRRFADRIYLVLDGDEAGRRRTNEILDLFLASAVDVRVLTLPGGLDPADYLQEHGPESFRRLLAGAADALEHKVTVATAGIDLARDTHGANRALEEILATMAKSPGGQAGAGDLALREQQVLVRLGRTFGVPEHQLRVRLGDLRRRPAAVRRPLGGSGGAAESSPPLRRRDMLPAEVELFEILLVAPQFVAEAIRQIEIGQLESPAAGALYRALLCVHEAGGTPDFGNVLTALEDPQLKNIWVELDEAAQAKAEDAGWTPRERFEGLMARLQHVHLTRDRQQKLTDLEQKRLSEPEGLVELLRVIAEEQKRRGISDPTDG